MSLPSAPDDHNIDEWAALLRAADLVGPSKGEERTHLAQHESQEARTRKEALRRPANRFGHSKFHVMPLTTRW